MRIGIDARFYGPKKQKGLGRYVQELVKGLEKLETNCQFVIFLRRNNWDEYQPNNNRFEKVLADYNWYSLAEQIFFPFKIWQAQIDLMHFPHFNVPLFCPVKFIVTIHDLILKHFPTRQASTLGPILYPIKNWAYQIVIRSAVRRAQKIIAVSQYTRNDILNSFNIRQDKVDVIYEGVSLIKKEQDSNILEKHKIANPYLLYVGNAYPHKNLERLVLSFGKLPADLQLVLVGQLDYFYNRLRNFVDNFDFKKRIIFTDFVSDEELMALYKNASLYAFPSLYEGFGLPPLEAMACGLPVVCSKTSCLPEILGKAAVYFNPQDTNDIIDKIKRVLYDKQTKEELISAGYERVKKYSWQKMAEEVFKIYGG